jgi:hypothetical protein
MLQKKYKKYEGKEDDFQKALAKYLDLKGVIYIHPPNGGTRNVIEATKLKKMGVKSGVPDILIFNRKRGYSGLAIELKVGYNKPSENQLEFMKQLSLEGWYCVVSYSLEECIDLVDSYLG